MRSHLGEPARLTGPAHFHMNSPLEVFYAMLWQCCLTANLVFLIVERFTLWHAVTQRIKTFKNFQLKMLHSVFLSISNPKKYISRTVIFASNRSKNSKIGCLKLKCKHLQNLVSTFPGKTSTLAATNQLHDSLFLI